MAVMITDILLLDFFNSVGMPTSTTVSIVFELLGAAVAIALIKIYASGGSFEDLITYINTSKASQIIFGILLSVIVAFSIGALVQWFSRLLLSYNFEKKAYWVGALFGGFALTAITYFIFMKGLKGTSYAKESFDILGGGTMKDFLENQVLSIVLVSSIFWSLLSYLMIALFKTNIYKLIIIVGTFALALAFAGNDLVNFIGVPVAAYNAFQEWTASGISATQFPMDVLAAKVPTNNWLLFGAGMIMVLTLWFSTKAKNVVKTSLDLSSQGETQERFQPNFLSRGFVRTAMLMSQISSYMLPESWQATIEKQFETPVVTLTKSEEKDQPAFDMVRAAVNLMVAAVLISIATSYKLPLSTTYVTFMVAMGTSLADRAWGAESAVYRVSGVLSVIGGWFFTAFSAFVVAFVVANVFYFGGMIAIIVVLVLAVYFIVRSHRQQDKKLEEQLAFEKSIEEGVYDKAKVIKLSAESLDGILAKLYNIIEDAIDGLHTENLKKLNKSAKKIDVIEAKAVKLRNAAAKALDAVNEEDMESAHMFILVVDYLTEMTKHVDAIVVSCLNHVDNNHKPMLDGQIEELKSINTELRKLLSSTIVVFKNLDLAEAEQSLADSEPFVKLVRTIRKNQLKRIKNHEIGTKNSMLFLAHLSEFRNLALFSNRLVQVCYDLVINPDETESEQTEEKKIDL